MARRYINHRAPMPGDAARKGGARVCRWCVKPLAPRRSSWCSDACHGEYMVRASGTWLRSAVHRRDKGVCALCEFDADAVVAQAHALWYGPSQARHYGEPASDRAGYEALKADLKARGFPLDYGMGPDGWKSLWEADHIVPVVDGAGACGLDNMRTLCVPCHKRVSADLAKRRAEERRAKKLTGDGTLFGVAS